MTTIHRAEYSTSGHALSSQIGIEAAHKIAKDFPIQTRIINFDEGDVEITIMNDGRVRCVNWPDCENILDATLAEIDGAGSAPVCAKCANAPSAQ